MAPTEKKKPERRTIAAVAIALGAVCQPAIAQDSKGLTVDVGDCVALEKPEERLACFEAQVEAARHREVPARASEPTVPSTDYAVPTGPSTDAVVESPKSASESRSDENGRGAERGSERQPVEIVAKVAELRQTVPNAYVITLDNGQVWRQAHPMPYPLRTGLVVRVRETKFGYRLSAPELHGQIQVERVR